ncbi:MAG: right-handed parallel beta-helix repeat-containing protein [Pseudomonadota bacterium]
MSEGREAALAAAIAAVVAVLPACTRPNPEYCSVEEGRPCADGVCIDHRCVSFDAGAIDSYSGCSRHEECESRLCDLKSRQCVDCQEGACAERSDGLLVCDEDSGECVQCVESADCLSSEPICDGSRQCRPCVTDDECQVRTQTAEVGRCDRAVGRCLESIEVAFVSASAACPGSGTSEEPYCQIQQAIDDSDRAWIIVRDGSYQPFAVDRSIMSIVAAPGAVPEVQSSETSTDVVRIGGNGADVLLDGLSVSGASPSSAGVACVESARCHLVRMRVTYNALGVYADNARQLVVERSVVASNNGGGILTEASTFEIVNSLIYKNGSGGSAIGGVELGLGYSTSEAPGVFKYNTVFANRAESRAPGGIVCRTAVTLSSSILWNNDGLEATRGTCAIENSIVEEPTLDGLNGNRSVDPQFEDASSITPDLHIKETSPCRDTGVADLAPVEDFFGQARDDGHPDIGADEHGLP